MSAPRVGALFAGYGGIELALHEVFDAEPAWFAENDTAPSRILANHWPNVPNHGDVTAIDWAAVERVDIITGGSPCQDLSHAGKRAGMKPGTRSGLWASMCDAIDIIRPALVVWENVRGALSAEADSAVEPCPICVGDRPGVTLRALGRVLGDLAELGYDAGWTGIRAADVGAPHGRWRVFVIAWPQSDPGALTWPQSDPGALTWPQSDPGALLPTPAVNDMGASYDPEEWDEWTARMQAAHGNGNGHGKSLHVEALRLLPTPTVSEANGAGEHGTGGIDLRTAVTLLPTPRATDGTKGGPNQRGSSGDLMLPSAVLLPTPSVADVEGGRKSRSGDRSGELLLNGLAAEWGKAALLPTPTATDAKASGATYAATDTHHAGTTLTDATVRQAERFGIYAPAIARWEALTRPAPAPTEPTGRDGAHRLSPAFVEWMMGLPAGWVTGVPGITRNDALKALGNGVVPQQAAAAIRQLTRLLGEARSRSAA